MTPSPRQNVTPKLVKDPSRSPAQPNPQLDAIMLLKSGQLDEAAALFEQIIAGDPENWQSVHLLGLIAYRQGQLERAADLIRKCLVINPTLAEGYSDLGVVLKDMGELDDAEAACQKAISLKATFHPAHNNLGNIYKAMRRLDDAAASYQRALELSPTFVDAHVNLGTVLLLLGKTEEALDSCLRAIELAPDHPEALSAFAHALMSSENLKDAITICQRAIELRPHHGPAYSDLGCVLQQDGQFSEAIQAHKKAIELRPDYAEAHNNLGIVYKELGRLEEALDAYRAAIELKPDYADAYSNMGVVLGNMGRTEEAIATYRKALEIDKGLLIAYINLAGALSEQDRMADAIATYAKALTIDPDHPSTLVDHYHLRRHACDWDGLAAAENKILNSTYREGKRVPSFPILNLPSATAEDHLLSARQWAKGIRHRATTDLSHPAPRGAPSERRLRVGYLSNDFYRHATTSLIAEMLERHDRSQFETYGYCFTKADGSAMRQRLVNTFDHFIEIGDLPYTEAARRINQDGIDILIDLKGYTTGARTEILACRPAPIQVNYLGYPGTMGAEFIDYIIADPFILPMDQQPFYDEKIVHLPGCYQPNDTKRPIASSAPSRQDCGLPQGAFVFCSFNASYKLTPEMFGVWTRLLQAVPGSVLWLLETNPLMRENLRRKAASMGVDPGRLIFAPKMELSQHLARHRHADLFLDSSPVNAHTTASDALWAGLPVLTCSGETFISRVCGSLLKAVGLSDLITYSLEHYEQLALHLARNPDSLRRLRDQLAKNRDTAPLFDVTRYTRGFEAALEHMSELRERDEGPRAFAVAEEDDQGQEKTVTPSPGHTAVAAPFTPEPASEAAPIVVESVSAGASSTMPGLSVSRVPYEACPFCDNAEFSVVKTVDCSSHPCYEPALPAKMNWCRCDACSHVFTDGYLPREARELVASKPLLHQTVGHDVEAQRLVAAKLVGQIAKLKPSGDWLDVGVGNAALLFTADEWGYRMVGIDPRPDNVEMLEKLGYEAYPGPVDELDMPERFSVISMSDVLQKAPQPRDVLVSARRLIQPGGILFCTMPNMASIVWRIMDSTNSNSYWMELEHHHNFTREKLYKLLEETGFRPVFYNVSERYRACMDVIAMSE